MKLPQFVLASAAACCGISVAVAQTTAPPPPPPQNLQVFPKDISRPELIANMKFFAQSLGVQCNFCHVGEQGHLDFPSDAKKEKLIARKMLAMVHRINQQDFGVTDFSKAEVTCFTCHRGSTHPLTAPPAAAPAVPAGSPAPASERGTS